MSAELIDFRSRENQRAVASVYLDWFTRVEQTAKQAGLPIFEDLLCRKTTSVRVSGNSGSFRELNSNKEFTDLKTYVEQATLPDGQMYTWDNWVTEARAACIAKNYSVSSDFHPQEVIEFYSEVEAYLERKPADAKEFWHVVMLVTKNQTDSKLASLKSFSETLKVQIAEGEELRLKQAEEIEELASQLENTEKLIGIIPVNFGERFKSIADLVELYDDERHRSSQLSHELELAQADITINERLVSELGKELADLKKHGGGDRAVEIERALEDAEQARRLLAKVQDRKSQSRITIAENEKTIANLRSLNSRLTKLVASRTQQAKEFEHKNKLAKSMNGRLIKAAAEHKQASFKAVCQLNTQKAERTVLIAKLNRARNVKYACFAGIALATSFSFVLAVHIIG